MYSAERYCVVCGCLFSLPDIRNPANPDPDEDCLLPYADPYDSRLLPREMTEVRHPSADPDMYRHQC